MPEQGVGKNRVVQPRGIDRHPGRLRPAHPVNRPGDELFADAAFAGDQHRLDAVGNRLDVPKQRLHPLASGQNPAESFTALQLRAHHGLFEGEVLLFQFLDLKGALNPGDQPFALGGLDEEVEGPGAHALDRGFDLIQAGENDHGDFRMLFTDPGQQLVPRKMGHVEIEQDQAELPAGQPFHDLATVAAGDDVIDRRGALQGDAQAEQPGFLVVHVQNGCFGIPGAVGHLFILLGGNG